ncbi:MAG: hypothetical protein MZU84_06375 [Sphingobacterium sp.]|nr:hypothetical protein [Sphingobacterium sp.]
MPRRAHRLLRAVPAPAASGEAGRNRRPSRGRQARSRDIAYVTAGHARQKLDLYLPQGGQGARRSSSTSTAAPSGWAARTDGVPVEYLCLGYAVASIGYRLSGDAIWPGPDRGLQGRRPLAARERDGHTGSIRTASPPGALPPAGTWPRCSARPAGSRSSRWARTWASPAACRRSSIISGRPTSCRWTRTACANGQVHDAADSPESQLVGGALQENKDKAARANPITYVTQG